MASFVEHELSKAIRGRMKDVAVELAEVDLDRSKLDSILKSLFEQYIVLAEDLLKKPAVWGPPKDEESHGWTIEEICPGIKLWLKAKPIPRI